MTHKLINTRDYLLIVDDSEIKKGDLWYNASISRIWKVSADNVAMYNQPSNMDRTGLNKIIAHLPLNNSPILEGVSLLPPLKDEVESLSLKSVNKRGYTTDDYQDGFEDGYNKAKERYKYTEEDIKNEIIRAFKYGQSNAEMMEAGLERNEVDDYTNNRIQSLQQPKMPTGFKYKTIVDEDNWVGEYIY